MKEAKTLNKLKHENVACLEKICFAPLTLLMEYYCFDFSMYGQEVFSMDKHLKFVKNLKFESSEPFNILAVQDIIKRMTFLHQQVYSIAISSRQIYI